jgi:Replication-relaxation
LTQGRPSRAAPSRTRSRCSARTPALSDLDLRILDLLASHRVLTQTQLASINPETPTRTLRYRCARLTREGLAGRSRPYRERGSAPHHFWPTRKGEAIVTGGPPPRGGERREPNPLFLAHAAGLSQVYVALATTLPAEVKLTRFEREADAREPFASWASREKRAIAPDAFIEITDADGGALLAFVELDLGSMSHRRLKAKAAGYAEYVKAEAWRERHRFCPALLFLTTAEKRARSFLAAMEKEAGRDSLLLTCGCGLARRLPDCASKDRWLLSVDEGKQAVDLLSALREARRPFDEEQERVRAERDREDAERERLRSDPEALRTHLRSRTHCDLGVERLGPPAAAALAFTLEQDGPLEEAERAALRTLGAMFADPLRVQLDDRELTAGERRTFDALVRCHLAGQLDRVGDLAERYGEGPALRKARKRLRGGELPDRNNPSWRLQEEARRDDDARAKQERLREDYLGGREQRARQLAKAQGIVGRLRNRPENFLEEVDRRSLRLCPSCEEVAYPDPEWARYERGARPDVAGRCHFCGAEKLAKIEPAAEEEGQP